MRTNITNNLFLFQFSFCVAYFIFIGNSLYRMLHPYVVSNLISPEYSNSTTNLTSSYTNNSTNSTTGLSVISSNVSNTAYGMFRVIFLLCFIVYCWNKCFPTKTLLHSHLHVCLKAAMLQQFVAQNHGDSMKHPVWRQTYIPLRSHSLPFQYSNIIWIADYKLSILIFL